MILDKYEIGFEIILVKGKIQKMEKKHDICHWGGEDILVKEMMKLPCKQTLWSKACFEW